MPAAAVIPAPIAYIKVVAVRKLVVGLLPESIGRRYATASGSGLASSWLPRLRLNAWCGTDDFYFEEIRVFTAGSSLE